MIQPLVMDLSGGPGQLRLGSKARSIIACAMDSTNQTTACSMGVQGRWQAKAARTWYNLMPCRHLTLQKVKNGVPSSPQLAEMQMNITQFWTNYKAARSWPWQNQTPEIDRNSTFFHTCGAAQASNPSQKRKLIFFAWFSVRSKQAV